MATLGSYSKRQSQTASAADSTMQALMMLMQHQQQSEDRRLSRQQMNLQNKQLKNLLESQRREERESQPGVATVRTLEQVFRQGDYAALEEVLKSSELYMQNPEIVFGETAVTDVPSAFVRGLGEDPNTQDYATLATELTNRFERLERFVRSTEIPKEEQDNLLNDMKSRIKDLTRTMEGEKFKKGIISAEVQRGIGEGSMKIGDTDNTQYMRGRLQSNPLFGGVDFKVSLDFLEDTSKQAVMETTKPVIQLLQNTVANMQNEDQQKAATALLDDPKVLNEIVNSDSPRSALFDKLGNMPEAGPGFFEQAGQVASDAGSAVADNPGTTGAAAYGVYKLAQGLGRYHIPTVLKPFLGPLLKFGAALDLPTRILQENYDSLPWYLQVPEVDGGKGVPGTVAGFSKAMDTERFEEGGEFSDVAPASTLELLAAGLGFDTLTPKDEETDVQAKSNYQMQQQLNLRRLLDGNTMGPEGLPPLSQLSPYDLPDAFLPEPAQPFRMFPPEAYAEQLGPPSPPPPPLYGPENQPLYGPENQPLYGPENQLLYGPENQPPLQGPLTQDQAQLQALASKIENAVAQDQAQQQALIEAGIFPMAGVSPNENLLQGPSTQMNAEIDEAFKFNELLEAYLAQPLQGPETQPPLYGPETQPPLQGPENQPLYGPETQPPLQGPLTQNQASLQESQMRAGAY